MPVPVYKHFLRTVSERAPRSGAVMRREKSVNADNQSAARQRADAKARQDRRPLSSQSPPSSCAFFHWGNPQAAHGLLAADFMNQNGNGSHYVPRVSADDFGNNGTLHKLAWDFSCFLSLEAAYCHFCGKIDPSCVMAPLLYCSPPGRGGDRQWRKCDAP